MRRRTQIAVTLVLSTAALAMLDTSSPVWAQQMTPEGAARTASSMSAIVQFCGTRYIIDGPKAAKLGAGSRQLALEWAQPGQGKALVNREFKRRLREVEITGPGHWCQNQREIHKSLGTNLFLN